MGYEMGCMMSIEISENLFCQYVQLGARYVDDSRAYADVKTEHSLGEYDVALCYYIIQRKTWRPPENSIEV